MKPRPYVQSSFDMQAARIAIRVFSFFLFNEKSERSVAFSEYFLYHFRFLFCMEREYVVRSFLPDGVFLPCDHGLDF